MAIKSRRIRCVGHVARMKARENAYRILVQKCEGRKGQDSKNECCTDTGWAAFILLQGRHFCTNGEMLCLAEQLSSSQEGLCSRLGHDHT